MSTLDTNPSNNGHGSDAWHGSWTHLRIDRRACGYCRLTFDHPPVNAITAATVAELAELVALIEEDRDLNVVVFDSANPNSYLGQYDARGDPCPGADPRFDAAGTPAWIDVLDRLSRAPVVSIAAIRGSARGAGTAFVLACDLRFASRENTRLGAFASGHGMAGGDGPTGRLPGLVGRGRALELLLVGDVDGPRAEQYGSVNRLIADDRLDDEVDAFACALADLDHDVIARAKAYVDRLAPPGSPAIRT